MADQLHTTPTPTPAPDVARPSPGTIPGRRGLLGGAAVLLAGASAVTLSRCPARPWPPALAPMPAPTPS